MLPSLELGLDQLFPRDQLQLRETAGVHARERLVAKVGERRPPEEVESGAKAGGSLLAARRTGAGQEQLQPQGVDLRRVDVEDVARRARHQDVPPQRLP